MSNGPGSTSYGLQESGDWKSGSLSQTETGQDRNSLMQGFANVSNAKPAAGPGNLDFSPFGMPFSDPPPAGVVQLTIVPFPVPIPTEAEAKKILWKRGLGPQPNNLILPPKAPEDKWNARKAYDDGYAAAQGKPAILVRG